MQAITGDTGGPVQIEVVRFGDTKAGPLAIEHVSDAPQIEVDP